MNLNHSHFIVAEESQLLPAKQSNKWINGCFLFGVLLMSDEACEGAHAIVVLTEWDEFKTWPPLTECSHAAQWSKRHSRNACQCIAEIRRVGEWCGASKKATYRRYMRRLNVIRDRRRRTQPLFSPFCALQGAKRLYIRAKTPWGRTAIIVTIIFFDP